MSTKVNGQLRGGQLSVAKLTIDRLQDVPKMDVLAGVSDETTGVTHAWVDHKNVQWSEDTKKALKELMACLERDLARAHFTGDVFSTKDVTTSETGFDVSPEGGLGEYLGKETGPHSI